GRLSAVIPKIVAAESKFVSAKYDCRVKIEYQKDLMGLLEEGMLLAIRNFKPSEGEDRFTLMEVSRVWPEHFGLRGLRDSSYYPMQFEIIQQSEGDWSTDDKSTMMVQISSIPINYDLFLKGDGSCEFKKGFSYPVIASEAYILNSTMINRMYNQRIVEKMDIDPYRTTEDARVDPRLGTIKMFEARRAKIPIYVDFESLVRYHFGVFAFTGGGKSNMMSNILRRILYHTQDTKIVIFDISCEYPFLLMDVFADPTIASKIILENRVDTLQQFYDSVVKPKEYEADPRVIEGFKKTFDLGDRIGYYTRPKLVIPNYAKFLDELKNLWKTNTDKPHYVNAIDEVKGAIMEYMDERRLVESQPIDEEFVNFIHEKASETVGKFKVSDRSGLYAWGTTRIELLDLFRKTREEEEKEIKGLTTRRIQGLIEGEERLVCISISDPGTIKSIVIALTRNMLAARKRAFKVRPYVLSVFDEAQEFIPAGAGGIDGQCSEHVERLLRQGRKYGLGGCVATQRIAYLNTNALQQLHTYYVGTLPRPYDRQVVSNTFMIDQGILEKTLEFAPGEWLLSSYIATGIENVPIFIRADNAETEVERFLAT
ncbi:MAG: ATP-binding protein, partial [Candidatus Bathyarchaeota archaeon]|nr:ATP-binding protein [Candidatus Bathyarchaeota archaeon]